MSLVGEATVYPEWGGGQSSLKKCADKIYARFASGKTNRGNRNFQRY